MKYPDLKKWKFDADLEELLLVAQIVEELLFDYTLDSYKVPAMNSSALCDELYQTIDDVEAGIIRQGAIKPIVEELCDMLGKDTTATNLLGDIKDELISYINRNDSIGEIKVRAELLKNKLSDNYLNENKRLLREIIVDSKQKEKIISLTRTLITQLISLGYSPEFIYFEAVDFFFSGRSPAVIDRISQIDDYIGKFSGQEVTMTTIYRASHNFEQLKDFAAGYEIRIQSERTAIKFAKQSTRIDNFLAENNELPLFIVVENVKGYDVFSVKEEGDGRVQLLENLSRYHIHREDFHWSEEAVVCSSDGRSFGVYKSPKSATYKRPEADANRLSSLVEKTFNMRWSPKFGLVVKVRSCP